MLADDRVLEIVEEVLERGCAFADGVGGWPGPEWDKDVGAICCELSERGLDAHGTLFQPERWVDLSPAEAENARTIILLRRPSGDHYDWDDLVLPALMRTSDALGVAVREDWAHALGKQQGTAGGRDHA